MNSRDVCTVGLADTGTYLLDYYFRLNLRCFYFISKYRDFTVNNMAWIRNFCLDPDLELGNSKLDPDSE